MRAQNRTQPNERSSIYVRVHAPKQKLPRLQVVVPPAPSIKKASARALFILSPGEVRDLLACEEVIEKGWETFLAVGHAPAGVRDKRLYRADFSTFEAFCRDRWNYGKSQAYRLIGAAEVVRHLCPVGDIQMPCNESQIPPSLGLKPDEIKEVWRQAVQKAGKRSVTARLVKQMAAELKSPTPAKIQSRKKTSTPQEIEEALIKAEDLLKKARISFHKANIAAVLTLLNQLAPIIRHRKVECYAIPDSTSFCAIDLGSMG